MATSQEPVVIQLEAKRQAMGLSQEQFAVRVLELSYTTYQRWLHRKFNPDYETLKRIQQVLDEDDLLLNAVSDPVLAELWDNPQDASYDEL